MENKQIYNLRINPIFRDLIPPLSKEEYETLESNLKNEGCREPICVWNYTILDGHNRYEICKRNAIPFQIRKINLYSEAEAIAWICANQLGRRNISEETRRYLIGKRYEAEKSIFWKRNPSGTNQYSVTSDRTTPAVEIPDESLSETVRANITSAKLGEEYNLSRPTVIKYGQYARAIERITEICPEAASEILAGNIKISQTAAIDLAKLKSGRIKRICLQMLEDYRERSAQTDIRKKVSEETAKKETETSAPVIEIKQMHEPDKDSDIISLSLTIPNWVRMISRVRTTTVISETSLTARTKLFTSISSLRRACDQLLDWIKES